MFLRKKIAPIHPDYDRFQYSAVFDYKTQVGAVQSYLYYDVSGAPTSDYQLTLNVWFKLAFGLSNTAFLWDNDDNGFRVFLGSVDRQIIIRINDGVNKDSTLAQRFRLVDNQHGLWHNLHITINTQADVGQRVLAWLNFEPGLLTQIEPDYNTPIDALADGNNFFIGQQNTTGNNPLYGLLCAPIVIDGAVLPYTDFYIKLNGVWYPKIFAKDYGTHGFSPAFLDDSDLGEDNYGPGNDLTESGMRTYYQRADNPWNNFPIWDAANGGGSTFTMYEAGALYNSLLPSGSWHGCRATVEIPSSGKWYFELRNKAHWGTGGFGGGGGVCDASYSPTSDPYNNADTVCYSGASRDIYTGNLVRTNYFDANPENDWVGVCVNRDDNEISFSEGGTQKTAYSFGAGESLWAVARSGYVGSDYHPIEVNFGDRAFAYTPPTGYNTLSEINIAAAA
jgi:hypothetical protein